MWIKTKGGCIDSLGNKVGQGLGFRPGYGRESRTVTLENGTYITISNYNIIINYCINYDVTFYCNWDCALMCPDLIVYILLAKVALIGFNKVICPCV
jgi:hypothetical protein